MNFNKIGKLFTNKFVGTGPSSYKKRIYRAAVSQRLRSTGLDYHPWTENVAATSGWKWQKCYPTRTCPDL